MEDMLLPFRRKNKEKEEKKKNVKEKVGRSISIKHKAKSRIREADLEFEKAFAEVMGVSPKRAGEKPIETKKVEIIGRKPKPKPPKEKKPPKPEPKPKKEKEPEKKKPEKKEEKKPVKVVGEKVPAKKWPTFSFWFCNVKAGSLAEFKKAMKRIPDNSLNHHAIHNDLSKYLRAFYSKRVADRVMGLENKHKGSVLREKLLKAL